MRRARKPASAATHPHVTDPVKDAVDSIEKILDEVLSVEHPDADKRTATLGRTDSATHI